MPNWCVGTLKVRGTKENLMKFCFEGLHPVGFLGESKGKLTLNKYGDICSDETCHIENTCRGFVEKPSVYFSDCVDDEVVIVTFSAKFAWSIDAEDLLKSCKKYHVDMKIHGFERGMEFNQMIEIVNGEIIKDEDITFDDYDWDCIFPELGG